MSWSVSFVARDKHHAKDLAHKARLPNIVNALIVDALDHVPESSPPKLIQVEGSGHQAQGSGSYEVSTCNLTVRPLTISS